MSTRWHRHKKILNLTKGYWGQANSCFRTAIRRWEKGQQYAYRDRRNKKRDFRQLWIQRISAGAQEHGVNYSRLIHGAKSADIELNRKVLADIAMSEPYSFKSVIEVVKSHPGFLGATGQDTAGHTKLLSTRKTDASSKQGQLGRVHKISYEEFQKLLEKNRVKKEESPSP